MLQRNAQRVVPPTPITAALANWRRTAVHGVVSNISEFGSCVSTTADATSNFDVGEGVIVTLGPPGVRLPFQAPGRIIWTGKSSPGTARYGLKFHPTGSHRHRLKHLIDHLTEEPLAREPSWEHLRAAFGRYEVQGEVGEGAMGRVYRGLDPLFRRAVAIKTIKTEYLAQSTRDEYLRRFRREAVAAGLLSHPNLVSVYDVGEGYVVMEFVEGRTLPALIKERTPTLSEAMDLLSPLAEAIDYAHGKGVLHRDVKPVNIMIHAKGHPKLMDFGIARIDPSVITVPSQFLGSPAYLAPEQIRGEEATFRADLFSFAVVAYELVTGHRPFEGADVRGILHKVVYEWAPAPRTWKPDLPEAFDRVFGRALSKTPEDRFPSARAFVAALRPQPATSRLDC